MLTMMTFVGGSGKGRKGTTTTTTGRRKAWGKSCTCARGPRAGHVFLRACRGSGGGGVRRKRQDGGRQCQGEGGRPCSFRSGRLPLSCQPCSQVASEKGKRGLAYVINWSETTIYFIRASCVSEFEACNETASATRERSSDEMCCIDGNGAHP